MRIDDLYEVLVTPPLISGPNVKTLLAGESLVLGDLVYLKSDGKWWKAKADAADTSSGLIGIALESKSAGEAIRVALPGSVVYNSGWSWTIGCILYISAVTGGLITETQPSATTNIIRVVGFPISATSIFLMPSGLYFTHV
jgi:hypothetical protein